jgi:hypothetical protein
MTHRTQTERLVAAARAAKGVCRIDFQLPDVIDGGDPILNFPGRMWDAERLGYCFEVIGKRNRCKIFRLISEPVESGAGTQSAPTSKGEDGPNGSSASPALSARRGIESPNRGTSTDAPPALFELVDESTGHWRAA